MNTAEQKLDALIEIVTKHFAKPIAPPRDRVFSEIANEQIDRRRPEFVLDMRDRIVDVLERHPDAPPKEKAEHIMLEFCRNYGGGQFYMPQDSFSPIEALHWEIYERFTGVNYFELAHEYGFSEVHVRNIVNKCRKAYSEKIQHKLPGL